MIKTLLKLGRPEPRDSEAGPESSNRYLTHGLAIVAVLVLVLSSAFSPVRAAPTGDPAATPTDLAMAQLPDWTRGSLPDWVRTTQETGLWSGPDERALLFSLIPANVTLKMQSVVQGGRAYVYYLGDGANRSAGPAWVDASALTPAAGPGVTPVVQQMQPLVAAPRRISSADPPLITAKYVSIIDEASGAVLYENRQHERVAPASTTKIATALVTLDRASSLSTMVTSQVSAMYMANTDGSSTMGIEPGQRVSIETLLYGLMLPSGNDAAEQLALTIGGNREQFAGWMTDKARSLGLQNTNFISPSGMDTPGHYSSAYDMAMLGRAGMQNADFRRIVGARSYQGDGFVFGNFNRLIGYYPGADGVKIGFTDEARKTFVASATRDGRRVFVSIMRSEDLWTDSIDLFDWVWDSFEW